MSFISLIFFLFTALAVAGYYLIPKSWQWKWLLAFSWIYYVAAGPWLICFLLFSIATTYLGGLAAERGSRRAVPITLILNFGMLAVLKYTGFVLGSFNALLGTSFPRGSLLLPLGISFYTFQSTGYLLDVYWKRCEAEKSLLRHALFLSFFPQIMQGPIGRKSRLSPQLFSEHHFDSSCFQKGLIRICWGFFKKLMIADHAAPYVTVIFDMSPVPGGYGIMGVLLYCAQLYADFSGGIDIVIGIGELFGITMEENFRQPFFAVSVSDFWHRWHITLGTWMKDYLFYPMSLSWWMGRFGKWCRRHMGKSVGRAMPICVANIIVFLVVGIWHGPAWHFIVYGLYNGLIIGISGLMGKPFRSWKKTLHINDKGAAFKTFQIIRTFILINISWFFDRCGSVSQAFGMLANAFKGPFFSLSLIEGEAPSAALLHFCVMMAAVLILLCNSILRERGVDTRGAALKLPAPARVVLLLLFVLAMGFAGAFNNYGGFIYANF